jgi:FMN phosphatase YigB (HAD superfamily)
LLYERAATDLGVTLPGAFVIGDTREDLEAARRFGGIGCLVSPISSEGMSMSAPTADFAGRDVSEVVDWILETETKRVGCPGQTLASSA